MKQITIKLFIVLGLFSVFISCSIVKPVPKKKEITRIFWMDEAGREIKRLPEYTPISVGVETKNIKAGEVIEFTIRDKEGRLYKGGFENFQINAAVGKNGKAFIHSIMLEYEPKNPPEKKSVEEIVFENDTLNWDIRIVRTRDRDTKRVYCITTIYGDTIVPFSDNYRRISFSHIDENGHSDIQVFYFNDEFEQCDSYLYDKENKVFRLIENCKVELRKIERTDFYYTYMPTGCANNNWDSYLYKLKDYQLVPCGRIEGRGCGEKRMIYIYRITEKKEILKEKSRYEKAIAKMGGDSRTDFYRNYWRTNYLNFERK